MMHAQRLIDAHHHFWILGQQLDYPWLGDQPVHDFFLGDYTAIRRAFQPSNLRRLIPQGYVLIGSVHCEAEAARHQAVEETFWVETLARTQELPTAHVGWAGFGTDTCASELDQQLCSALFRGVRAKPVTAKRPDQLHTVRGQPGSLQDDRWCSGLQLLAERDLSWDLRVPAWHLSEAAERLQEHPTLRVILNHCGLPWDRSEQGLRSWRQGIAALASNPNVCVKLSELGTPGRPWIAEDNRALLVELLQVFGPQRCLYASNAPVSGLQVGYADWLALVESVITQVVPNARDDVLWRNAARWYRLDLPSDLS
ncbi:L-fuconolactone hydrolase [Marinobacterium lacunae]|uniref:L-fuconolactone hydrolase n=1 Tax=Marinobacterium lacunae TaxID=1232683 RepID=A0A081FZK7_9GAMM|nr:amidohydrolase family protein [Marinobacterium lacunae]KEA63962.1 L-fuconolactone hydrolase [Marinobacterium lacunae]